MDLVGALHAKLTPCCRCRCAAASTPAARDKADLRGALDKFEVACDDLLQLEAARSSGVASQDRTVAGIQRQTAALGGLRAELQAFADGKAG